MWNLSTTKNNDIYSIHCKVEVEFFLLCFFKYFHHQAQKKHLYNLNHAKPIVDNKLPWMPYRIYSEKTKTKDGNFLRIY